MEVIHNALMKEASPAARFDVQIETPEVGVVQIGGVAGGNFYKRKEASNHISVSGPDLGADPAHFRNTVHEKCLRQFG
jgi:hypothetical protein